MADVPFRSHVPAILLAITALSSSARAQCLDWEPGLCFPGTDGQVLSLAVHDDGSGPALYTGGIFSRAGDGASSSDAQYIAAWRNGLWSGLGSGLAHPPGAGGTLAVYGMKSFDDGSGPALYAGGAFTVAGGSTAYQVARWNGSAWSDVGGFSHNNFVYDLEVYDDGSGPALYVTNGTIWRWDGATWTEVPGTFSVWELEVLDLGTGPALYAGGSFWMIGGVQAVGVARFDGSAWSALGAGLGSAGPSPGVRELAAFDDGSGPALYAGGYFTGSGGTPIRRLARFDGTSWSEVGGGVTGASQTFVEALDVHDDGSGPALFVGGRFSRAGSVLASNVARWNGSSWSPLGSGADGYVRDLEVFDAGSGPRLHAAGDFHLAGGVPAGGIASWDGGGWTAPGVGSGGADANIAAFATFDAGSATELWAAGSFQSIEGVPAARIARRVGATWGALGTGADAPIHALASSTSAGISGVYAGGLFATIDSVLSNRIARWNGSSWSALAGGTDGPVYAIAEYGSEIYIAGKFAVPGFNIARWNGTSWSMPANGLFGESVRALAVFDDGSGPALYAGGEFWGTPTTLMRWDGAQWAPVPDAPYQYKIYALTVHDDGSGPALYVGGWFTEVDGQTINYIARWDGTSWSGLGGGVDGHVATLSIFDDGRGPALYAGGSFTEAGGVPARGLARWDGTSWSAVGGSIDGHYPLGVNALASFDDGTSGGADLYVGGEFSSVAGVASRNLAVWRGCEGPGTLVCAGDGSLASCPCSNSGAPAHGCENSASTGGAVLASAGTTNPDTVVLATFGELSSALSIFLQGDAFLASPAAFGDGLRCTGGALRRLYVKNASGGSAAAPTGGEPSITVRSAQLGDPIAAGSTRWYQTYYRDPSPSFCAAPAGNTFNVTNGLRIGW